MSKRNPIENIKTFTEKAQNHRADLFIPQRQELQYSKNIQAYCLKDVKKKVTEEVAGVGSQIFYIG